MVSKTLANKEGRGIDKTYSECQTTKKKKRKARRQRKKKT